MSGTSTLASFATAVLIILISYFFNDRLSDLHSELQQLSFECMQAHNEFVSDTTRFTATTSMAAAKLSFSPLPADYKEWFRWFTKTAQVCLGTIHQVKNAEQHTENNSYYSLWIMGYRWDHDIEMWLDKTQVVFARTSPA